MVVVALPCIFIFHISYVSFSVIVILFVGMLCFDVCCLIFEEIVVFLMFYSIKHLPS